MREGDLYNIGKTPLPKERSNSDYTVGRVFAVLAFGHFATDLAPALRRANAVVIRHAINVDIFDFD